MRGSIRDRTVSVHFVEYLFLLVLGLSGGRQAEAQANPPISNLGASGARISEDWLVYSQWESFAGEDLHGDGDTADTVVHVDNLLTGRTTNLRLVGDFSAVVSGDWLVFRVQESQQGW